MYCAKLLQACPAVCDPMDCSPPGSSVHGILQTRILEWVVMPSSSGSSQPRDWSHISHVSCVGRKVLYHQCHLGNSYTCICTQIMWFYACIHVYVYMKTHCVQVYVYIWLCVCMYIYITIYAHIHIYKYTYIHTHTYTYNTAELIWLFPCLCL